MEAGVRRRLRQPSSQGFPLATGEVDKLTRGGATAAASGVGEAGELVKSRSMRSARNVSRRPL